MNAKTTALSVVIAAFSVLTIYALMSVGFSGIFGILTVNAGGTQVFIDLVIACGLIIIWMVNDARERSFSAWPFVVITLAAGSFGPLLYLLRRFWGQESTAAT